MNLPKEIQIEPTINCNLDCIMCNREARMRGARDMTLKEFKQIINQFPDLKKIHLHGIGESFLNKDFLNMINYAKQKRIYVCFNSNFTLVHKDFAERLVDLKVDEIRASLDSANKETYQKIRRHDMFDKVIENIKNLAQVKKEKNSNLPYLKVVVVATKYNLVDLPNLIELACSLGVNEIFVQNLQSWSKKEFRETVKKENSIFYEDRKKVQEAFKKTRETAEKLGVKLSQPQLKEKKFSCTWPWTSCWVSVEGFVTPCCNCSDPRTKNFGNLFEKPIEEIWNSQEYNKFREDLKSGNIPEVCKECIILSGDFKDYG